MDFNLAEFAKNRLEKAKILFNCCDCDDSIFEYANAELTAAEQYYNYALSLKNS